MNEQRLVMTIKPDLHETRILLTRGPDEVLRAVLPSPSHIHCRAAPTLAEAIALWFQSQVSIVLYADVRDRQFAMDLCDGLGFGLHNVHFDVTVLMPEDLRRGQRLGGKGRFSDLRQLCLKGVL